MNKEEVFASFSALIQSLECPACAQTFTETAVAWGEAWSAGRREALQELGLTERDGPYKVKCEYCGAHSFINYFSRQAELAK